MNKGIKISKGEIIAILNSDDYYEPGVISKVVETFLSDDNIEIVSGVLRYIERNKKEICKVYSNFWDSKYLKKHKVISHPTAFIKRSVYNKIGLYDVKYNISSDYDFFCRCLLENIQQKFLDIIITNMRIGGISSKLENSKISITENYNIIKKYFSKKDAISYLIQKILRYYIITITLKLKIYNFIKNLK